MTPGCERSQFSIQTIIPKKTIKIINPVLKKKPKKKKIKKQNFHGKNKLNVNYSFTLLEYISL